MDRSIETRLWCARSKEDVALLLVPDPLYITRPLYYEPINVVGIVWVDFEPKHDMNSVFTDWHATTGAHNDVY